MIRQSSFKGPFYTHTDKISVTDEVIVLAKRSRKSLWKRLNYIRKQSPASIKHKNGFIGVRRSRNYVFMANSKHYIQVQNNKSIVANFLFTSERETDSNPKEQRLKKVFHKNLVRIHLEP